MYTQTTEHINIFIRRMDWWQKLRRTWSLVPPLFKLHKSGGGGGGAGSGGNGDRAGGLLKLQDDVEMCGYRDVEVMWNMLSIKQTQKMEGRGRVKMKGKLAKRSSKQRPIWRIFSWPNHEELHVSRSRVESPELMRK